MHKGATKRLVATYKAGRLWNYLAWLTTQTLRGEGQHYKDVCEIFRIVAQERKRREIDPTLRVLQECVGELKKCSGRNLYTKERLEEMLGFLTTGSGLFEELLHMPFGVLKSTVRLRGKFASLFRPDKKTVTK